MVLWRDEQHRAADTEMGIGLNMRLDHGNYTYWDKVATSWANGGE